MMKHFCFVGVREHFGLFDFILDKVYFKFIWKDQCLRIAKKVVRKNNRRWREECILDFKTH